METLFDYTNDAQDNDEERELGLAMRSFGRKRMTDMNFAYKDGWPG